MKNNIKLKVEFLINEQNEYIDYENITSNLPFNNISNKSALSSTTNNQNPFLFSVSKLGSFETLLNEYKGIIIIKNNYSDEVIINLPLNNVDNLVIFFDKKHSFPKTYIINDSDTYSNDDYIINIKYENSYSGNLKITFKNWNYDEIVTVIDAIYTQLEEEFETNSISDLVLGNEISSDNIKPNFGVIGYYGSLKINDKNNILDNYLKNDLLSSKAILKFYYNENIITTYISKKWQKSVKDNKFSIELDDGLEDFSKKTIKIYYTKMKINSYDFFIKYIFANANKKTYYIDEDTTNHLKKIIFNSYYFENITLLELMNYFCNTTMTCIKLTNDELEVQKYV